MKLRLSLLVAILVSLVLALVLLALPALAADDITPPVTTDNSDGLWHNADVTLTLTAVDTETYPYLTFYSIDGSAPPVSGGVVGADPTILTTDILVAAPSDHSNDGVHTVSYWSEDNVLNAESPPKSCTVSIDTLAPLTTASGIDLNWHNGSVLVSLVAADPSPALTVAFSGVKETWYSVDGAPAVQGTSFSVPAVNGTHPVTYWSVDNAGNIEPTVTGNVRIDMNAPTTTVSGNDTRWHRKPVVLDFFASDVGPAGVRKTQYKIDGRSWVTGTSATVKAPSNHTWDGKHTVRYRSVDWAGNIETYKSCTVRIDTKGPSCTAPSAASTVTGSYVTLKYRANDAHSPTANVTIKVKTLTGSTVKTIALTGRRTNTTLSTSFQCKLAPKTYRFFVYATDVAGNPQSQVGSNRLTVKPRVFASLSASVSDSTPAQYSNVSAYAKARDQLGHGLSGVKVTYVWHYKTTTPSETHYTASTGVATCTRNISGATTGYRVWITITATYKGVTKTASTSFVPH